MGRGLSPSLFCWVATPLLWCGPVLSLPWWVVVCGTPSSLPLLPFLPGPVPLVVCGCPPPTTVSGAPFPLVVCGCPGCPAPYFGLWSPRVPGGLWLSWLPTPYYGFRWWFGWWFCWVAWVVWGWWLVGSLSSAPLFVSFGSDSPHSFGSTLTLWGTRSVTPMTLVSRGWPLFDHRPVSSDLAPAGEPTHPHV